MMKQYAFFLGLSLELAALIVVFLFIGREIDDYLAWNGIGIVVSVAFAMCIWIYHLVLAMRKINNADKPGS